MVENENNEVEVEVHDTTTNDMLDNMIAGKASNVQDNFNDLMHKRSTEALDQRKVELAKDMYKQTVDPDMEPQGVSLEDSLVDINTETGRPIEKEETNENT